MPSYMVIQEAKQGPVYFEFKGLTKRQQTLANIYPYGINSLSLSSWSVPVQYTTETNRLYVDAPDDAPTGEITFHVNGIVRCCVSLKMWIEFSRNIKKSFYESTYNKDDTSESIFHSNDIHIHMESREHIEYPLDSLKMNPGDCLSVYFTPFDEPKTKDLLLAVNFITKPFR